MSSPWAMPGRRKFTSWEITPDTVLGEVLPPVSEMPRCGIYRLRFDDGRMYVGSTTSLEARFATHRKRQQGKIVKLDFSPVPRTELAPAVETERVMAEQRREKLRKMEMVDLPATPPLLETYVDSGELEQWLNGDPALVLGTRTEEPSDAARSAAKFEKLQKHPDYERIVSFYADYLEHCVPCPDATEGVFWSFTTYPSADKAPGYRRVSSLSIAGEDVVVFFEDLQGHGHWQLGAYLVCAGDTEVPASISNWVWRGNDFHQGDELRLEMRNDRWWRLLGYQRIEAGARRSAMELLMNASSPVAASRSHDHRLAAAVFEELQRRV